MGINYTDIAEKLLAILEKNKSILIMIKGSPDPDGIGAALFLKILAAKTGSKAAIFAEKMVSLPQNQSMISKLGVKISYNKPHFDNFDGYIVTDFQTAAIEQDKGQVPCLIHIDHHAPVKGDVSAGYRYLTEECNAVSTIFGGVLLEKAALFSKKEITLIATALLYGIITDTDNLSIARDTDRQIHDRLKEKADIKILSGLQEIPYSEETLTLISKAMIGSTYYRDWLISGIGFVPGKMRDSIAITSDFLLEREDVTTVIVFAIIESDKDLHLDASFRTKNKNLDLNQIIKSITPNGGGRRYKGAFQLDLSYFKEIKNRAKLWSIINDATVENLKKERDHLPISTVTHIFTQVREQIASLFSHNNKE